MFLPSARRVDLEVNCDDDRWSHHGSTRSLPWQFCCTICYWEDKFIIFFFFWSILPSRWFFEDKFLMHPTFPNLPGLLSKYLLSKIPPAISSQPRKIPGNTFLPDWWVLAWSFGEVGWYSTLAPKGIIGPVNGSPNRLSYGVFPSAKRSWTFRRQQ